MGKKPELAAPFARQGVVAAGELRIDHSHHMSKLGVCVCVRLSHSVSKSFSDYAGGQRMASRRWPTKLVMSCKAVRDVRLCTCLTFVQAVTPHSTIHGFSRYFPQAFLLQPLSAAARLQTREHFVKPSNCADFTTLRFHRSFH